MNRRVTQQDVAKKANVHVTTVSLALRNHPSLPVTTRERLRTLADKMGYRPDPALSALINYRTKSRAHIQTPTIAYITNWNTRWGWKHDRPHAEFYAGAVARAHELGYQLEHFWMGEPDLTHKRMSNMLGARGIRGVIIASHRYEIDTPLHFAWANFSAVKIDFFPHEPTLHNVTNDQRAIIQLAMRHVTAAGYRRVGFVMDRQWDLGVDLAWSAGCLAEQQLLAPKNRIPLLLFSQAAPGKDPDHEDRSVPRAIFEAWFRQFRPDALISTRQFVQAPLAEAGIAVPRDLGFADILLNTFDGKTAGVRQNCQRVGELAVEILASQLQQNIYGIPAYPTATLVEGTWLDGASLPSRSGTDARKPSPARRKARMARS